ncbi:MAG: iron-sulfur cluster repair di-iron protein [Verrucomicrobia bacterium]|nr:iron-sulfur cluster repair di-iron protein [Verrucomicrobiota bacterium]
MTSFIATPIGITPEITIGELVAARPLLSRVFERLGIDYCCGGKQTLAAACAKLGLDLKTTRALLELAADTTQSGAAEVDAAAMGLAELADHIETTHHAYLKEELPRLVEMADRVARKHGDRDQRLQEVAAVTRALTEEMIFHMQKEETVLFPLVRQIGAGQGRISAALLSGPIQQMETEHQAAGDAIARLRLLTDGFAQAGTFCRTHHAMFAGLAALEADLHRHVHKENNVLFPRALAQADLKGGSR